MQQSRALSAHGGNFVSYHNRFVLNVTIFVGQILLLNNVTAHKAGQNRTFQCGFFKLSKITLEVLCNC